tara:strand:+ start:579 stop:980 length:402 start_codon:yes stop_codon:yes gene_type:complete
MKYEAILALHNESNPNTGLSIQGSVEELTGLENVKSNNKAPTFTWDEVLAKEKELQAEYPMQLLRVERDGKLRVEVDPKTCEAYNNGTQLSNEWKNYRQALLDMTLQTPTLDENGNLKAGLELDEIYWPTKPE